MELEEIKEFLRNKPGYLKEGGRRLRDLLRERGFATTIYNCKQAIREVTAEVKEKEKRIYEGEARILIYDIETSPNIGWFWRAGYKQTITPEQILEERKVICVSYKWHGEDEVYNLTWDNDKDDRFLIEQFVEVLNEADLIVAHNGDNFDLKWLRTRALVHGIPMLPNYKQADTLKIAKRKLYANSNKLDYLLKLFGLDQKKKLGREVWLKIFLFNDKEAMTEMLDYCDRDVTALEQLYDILKYTENPMLHAGVQKELVKQTSPITGSVNIEHVKKVTTNRGTVKHIMQDKDTKRYFEMSDTNYKKFITINE